MKKKILRGLGIFLLVLIGTLVSIPFLFKDKLERIVAEQIRQFVDADVHYETASLSIFNDFPNLRLGIKSLDIDNRIPFEGKSLAKDIDLHISIDLMSVLKNDVPVKIIKLELANGIISILTNSEGISNYDIVKTPEDSSNSSANHSYELTSYGLKKTQIYYVDLELGIEAVLNNASHTGAGNLALDSLTLQTQTTIEKANLKYGGVTYLDEVKLDAEVDLDVNMDSGLFKLKENKISLNEFELEADGSFQTGWDFSDFDLSFSSNKNDFRHFLSLVPSFYTKDFSKISAAGIFDFSGWINGRYEPAKKAYPSFETKLNIENGSFKYPGLPVEIRSIQTKLDIVGNGGDLNQMVINASKFGFKIKEEQFEGSLFMKNILTDPYLKGKLMGDIDLAVLSNALPPNTIENMSGKIGSDIQFDLKYSQVGKPGIDNAVLEGQLELKEVKLKSNGFPPISIPGGQINTNISKTDIEDLKLNIGESDFSIQGEIDNVLAFFLPGKQTVGTLQSKSKLINLNEFTSESSSQIDTSFLTETSSFNHLSIALDMEADLIQYDDYNFEQLKANGQLEGDGLWISKATGRLNGTDFKVSGNLSSLLPYLLEGKTLEGDLRITAPEINLNAFMNEDTENTGSSSFVLIPEKMNLEIDVQTPKAQYGTWNLSQVSGKLRISDRELFFDDLIANALGGKMAVSGKYGTTNTTKPDYELKYDLASIDFQKAFTEINTFSWLAPVGKFLKGSFNNSMLLSGSLNEKLMPIIDDLSGAGFIETIDGVIEQYHPFQKINENLKINFLESVPIKNTRNWFEIENGVVEVKEFNLPYKDIALKISGKHSITQNVDYLIRAKIPRKYFDSNPLGETAGKGLNWLSTESKKIGINLASGDYVNVNIYLKGNIKDPDITAKLIGIDGESSLEESVKKEIDESVEVIKDSIKKETAKQVEKVKDSVKTVVTKKSDEVKSQVESAAKKEADSIAAKLGKEVKGAIPDSLKTKVEEAVKDQPEVEKEIKKIKDLLKNPFGKKDKKENEE